FGGDRRTRNASPDTDFSSDGLITQGRVAMSPIPEPRDVDTAAAEQPHHMPRLLATRPLPTPVAANDADGAMDPRRIFGALKYHWFVFIVLGSLLGAGLGAAAWELLPAKYTTTALLRVNSSNAGLLTSDPTTARSEFL